MKNKKKIIIIKTILTKKVNRKLHQNKQMKMNIHFSQVQESEELETLKRMQKKEISIIIWRKYSKKKQKMNQLIRQITHKVIIKAKLIPNQMKLKKNTIMYKMKNISQLE